MKAGVDKCLSLILLFPLLMSMMSCQPSILANSLEKESGHAARERETNTMPDLVTAESVARAIEAIAPLDSGVPNDELGFLFGDPKTPVTGVACVWLAHPQSVRKCIESGTNMIVCHESLWYPEQDSAWYKGPASGQIFSNRALRELLEKNKLVVYRIHSPWDALPKDGVHDQAVTALELEGLKEIARQKFFAVQELPNPITVTDLKHAVESGWRYPDCRVFGDADKEVRRFAVLIGGFGENQVHMPQAAIEMGAEAIIIGEMSEGILLASLEMGVPVIESLHSISETPGVKRQAALVAERFPNLPVTFIPSGAHSFPTHCASRKFTPTDR